MTSFLTFVNKSFFDKAEMTSLGLNIGYLLDIKLPFPIWLYKLIHSDYNLVLPFFLRLHDIEQ